MTPDLRVGRKTLSYPIWAVDFDPSNHDFLLVGGGGGSTSSGVPNKITLLDVSKTSNLNEIVDLELAKDEDSVTSLAIAEADTKSLTAYAGINSSTADQEKGKNDHFRSFRVGLPARKRVASGEETHDENQQSTPLRTEALGRTAFFRSASEKKSETYQRKLRVAPAHREGGSRVVAIASGLASQNEVITLRATTAPGPSNVISRINLESSEAADLDVAAVEDESKSSVLAYCTDYEVFVQHIPGSGKDAKEPVRVSGSAKPAHGSKIKCIRWLGSRYLVLLRNRPNFSGSELEIIKTDKDYTQSQVVLIKKLSKATKSAIGLDTCALSAGSTGEQQYVIGVVGQDCSVEILVVDYTSYSGLSKIKSFTRLREVQPGPITGIRFSTFIPPPSPVSKDTKPQIIRVASVSATNVVVVHTLPLRPHPPTSKSPRYLLVPPPETLQFAISVFVALLVVGITALCMQVFCEVRGVVPPYLHAQTWLSPRWQDRIARPYIFRNKGGPVIPESMPPIIETAPSSASSILDTVSESLRSAGEAASNSASTGASLLSDLVSSQLSNEDQMIVIRDDTHNPDNDLNLATELHDKGSQILDSLKSSEAVKKWDDLTHEQKRGWKKKLQDAGHWTEKEGEKVLKGILWGELAGVVGAALHG